MKRSELVRLLVLNDTSDDYENVDQTVLRHVAEDAAKLGLPIARSDIVDALANLIEDGLAKAYLLSGPKPRELEGMPPLDRVEEDFKTWFYITKKGLEFHGSNRASWPFDDEGNPRG